MSDDKEVAAKDVDVLIDPDDEIELFKASPISLSKDGENSWLHNQALYRKLDYERHAERQDKYNAAGLVAQNEHIRATNRFNLINSVVNFAAMSAIILILLQATS